MDFVKVSNKPPTLPVIGCEKSTSSDKCMHDEWKIETYNAFL